MPNRRAPRRRAKGQVVAPACSTLANRCQQKNTSEKMRLPAGDWKRKPKIARRQSLSSVDQNAERSENRRRLPVRPFGGSGRCRTKIRRIEKDLVRLSIQAHRLGTHLGLY